LDLVLAIAGIKMMHAGHLSEIDALLDVCLTFDNVARSLAQHGGYARADIREGKDVPRESVLMIIILFESGENVREHPLFYL